MLDVWTVLARDWAVPDTARPLMIFVVSQIPTRPPLFWPSPGRAPSFMRLLLARPNLHQTFYFVDQAQSDS